MAELTDLEICKRIAEIEGVDAYQHASYPDNPLWQRVNGIAEVYNPLTDDALCFRLMLKHDIAINRDGDGYYWVAGRSIADNLHKNPNKAICLAIIAAHK